MCVCLAGEFYANVARSAGYLTLLDGYRGVDEVLNTKLVHTLKINRSEFEMIKARVAEKAANDTAKGTLDDDARVRLVFNKYKLRWIAVTAGAGPSELLCQDGRRWVFVLPHLAPGSLYIVHMCGARSLTFACVLFA